MYAASTCPPPPEMTMSRLQERRAAWVLSQIVVKVLRDGIPLNQAATDDKGRFEFKGLAPEYVSVRIQFLGNKVAGPACAGQARRALSYVADARDSWAVGYAL